MASGEAMSGFLRRLLSIAARPMRRDRGRGGYVVHPYRGYGSRHEVFLMGRVFRQAALGEVIPRYGMLRDLADILRRLVRHGLPAATVEVTLGENVTTVTTDRDGYFDVHMPLEAPLPRDSAWHHAELHVVLPGVEPVQSFTEVYIPPAEADLLVISDIDDTVMYTGVANKLRMLALAAAVSFGGGGVFLVAAALLKIEELSMVAGYVTKKVRKRLGR